MELQEVCDVITCGVAKRPEYKTEGIPFLSSKNVKEDRFILDHFNYVSEDDFLQLTKHNKPEKGDVLYTRVGSFGEAAVIDLNFDFAIFVSLTLLKPKKDLVFPRFLMYYLNSPKIKKLAISSTSGIGVQNLNVSTVRKFPIDLPPLTTQKKIAQILDDAAALRDKTAQLLTEYDVLAQSIFLEMFGDPGTNVKDFEIRQLDEFYVSKKEGTKCGPFGGALKKEEYVDKGIAVWNMDNISKNGELNSDIKLWITKEKFSKLKPYNVKNDDIIISRAGTVGKMCVVSSTYNKSIISTNLIRLRLDSSKLLPLFFSIMMNYFKERVGRLKTGAEGAFTHMNTGVLNNLKFPYPPIDLQNQFAEKISLIDKQKELAKQELKESEDLFNCLLQKAFKGELVKE